MNIFVLTYYDMGGGGHRLATAINEHTPHEAVAARWDNEPWTTGGLFYPGEERICELYEWADVVQIQNTIISHIPVDLLTTKPLIFYYRGSDFRDNYEAMSARSEELGARESVNFLDLAALCNVELWLPTVVEDFSYMRSSRHGFRVCQCPSTQARYAAKHTEQVVQKMRSASGVRFELITGLPWKESLQHKARCHAVIDQFVWGYGNSGVEAMSMGIPVLADADPRIIAEMQKRIGYLPFIRSTIEQLPGVCEPLRRNAVYRREWEARSREYWRAFHSPEAVASRAIEMFAETIDLWKGG